MPRNAANTWQDGSDYAERLMNFFYPMHYRLGMEMESAMGQGRVDRKQGAMLWLIFSRRDSEGWVRRKEILRELSGWFEISEAKVSRMLRELSNDPTDFIILAESPDSSRERVLRLSDSGVSFVETMRLEAMSYLAKQMQHLSREELDWGLSFLEKAFFRTASAARTLPPFPGER
ncbi:MAG: hypothetical protein AB7G24_13050 [Novosphingobium sp.]